MLSKYVISYVIELGPGPFMELSGLSLPSSGPSLPAQAQLDQADGGSLLPTLGQTTHSTLVIGHKIKLLFKKKKENLPLLLISREARSSPPPLHRLCTTQRNIFLFVLNLLPSKFSVLILCDRQPSDFLSTFF